MAGWRSAVRSSGRPCRGAAMSAVVVVILGFGLCAWLSWHALPCVALPGRARTAWQAGGVPGPSRPRAALRRRAGVGPAAAARGGAGVGAAWAAGRRLGRGGGRGRVGSARGGRRSRSAVASRPASGAGRRRVGAVPDGIGRRSRRCDGRRASARRRRLAPVGRAAPAGVGFTAGAVGAGVALAAPARSGSRSRAAVPGRRDGARCPGSEPAPDSPYAERDRRRGRG